MELLKRQVLKCVKSHNDVLPIKSEELEQLFGVKGPSIRNIIRQLRRTGHPIAESNKGYYYADSFEMIRDTVEDLEGRAKSLLKTAGCLRRRFAKQSSGKSLKRTTTNNLIRKTEQQRLFE